MSREQVVSKPPRRGGSIHGSMIGRWPEVLQEETQRFFRREAPDRRNRVRNPAFPINF